MSYSQIAEAEKITFYKPNFQGSGFTWLIGKNLPEWRSKTENCNFIFKKIFIFDFFKRMMKFWFSADHRFWIIWMISQTPKLERSKRKILIQTLSMLCNKICFNLAPRDPLTRPFDMRTFNLEFTYWTYWMFY